MSARGAGRGGPGPGRSTRRGGNTQVGAGSAAAMPTGRGGGGGGRGGRGGRGGGSGRGGRGRGRGTRGRGGEFRGAGWRGRGQGYRGRGGAFNRGGRGTIDLFDVTDDDLFGFGSASRRSASVDSASFSAQTCPEASSEVVEFTSRISRVVGKRSFTLVLDDPHDMQLWMQSWSAVAAGARISGASSLLRALMRLPASVALVPPALDVLGASAILLESSNPVSERAIAKAMDLVELAVDAVEHRLFRGVRLVPQSQRTSCAETASRLQTAAHVSLLRFVANPAHAQRAARLLGRAIGQFERYAREVARDVPAEHGDTVVEGASAAEHARPWMGWRNPTLGWLQRGKFLAAPGLQRAYENVEEYAETLQSLVAMLAFYWGSGALFLKCRIRGPDDRPCDQPLVTYAPNEKGKLCGRRLPGGQSCHREFRWRCFRHNHDVACEPCVRQLQASLVGKPGPRASTDVYDGVVERETVRRDGIVYQLSRLASRKPPSVSPNWRTTYRLQCAALVAVVRLGASFEAIPSSRRVDWAEVVPVNPVAGSIGDHEERACGRLALRMLTRQDISTLGHGSDPLEMGTRVAVIDMRVFVPEVLSVLSTLTDPALIEHLRELPFCEALLGASSALLCLPSGDHPVEAVVNSAVENSEIDAIARLPPEPKSALSGELSALARAYNLYGTQLDAFASALGSSLHCTQGPPGTGKSYVGVVLIHALNIVRKYASLNGNVVGPIIVLSYKNHALDEILIDALAGDSWRSAIRNGLIRCGRSDDERLGRFSERSSPEERRAQEALSERVSCLRSAQRKVKEWRFLRVIISSGIHGNTDRDLDILGDGKDGKDLLAAVLQALRLQCCIDSSPGFEGHAEQAYSVLDKASLDRTTALPYLDSTTQDLVCKLRDDAEHWVDLGPSRSRFLVANWLLGRSPPPRCIAVLEERRCLMVTSQAGSLCSELHRCKYQQECPSHRAEGSLYCVSHQCDFPTLPDERCLYPRIERSAVCALHACNFCVGSEELVVKAKIGSACAEHTCRYSGGCSNAYLLEELPFCQHHCCISCIELQQSGHDLAAVKALERVDGSDFCREHKCLANTCAARRLTGKGIQDFCPGHACSACDGLRSRVDPLLPESGLCTEHRCRFNGMDGTYLCELQKMGGGHFCESHTCRFCVEEGVSLDRMVRDRPPRNVCSLHPLCTFVSPDGADCTERVHASARQLCEEHALLRQSQETQPCQQTRCCGMTTKRRPCRTHGVGKPGSFYCPPHADQAPDTVSDSSLSEDDDDDSSTSDEDEMDVVSDGIDVEDGSSVREKSTAQSCALEAAENQKCSSKGQKDIPVSPRRRCFGTNKKGKPCGTVGLASPGTNFFCEAHQDQRSAGTAGNCGEVLGDEYPHPEKGTLDVEPEPSPCISAGSGSRNAGPLAATEPRSIADTEDEQLCPKPVAAVGSCGLAEDVDASETENRLECQNRDGIDAAVEGEPAHTGGHLTQLSAHPSESDTDEDEDESSSSEEEMATELQRLREIAGNSSESDSASDADGSEISFVADVVGDNTNSRASGWAWTQSMSERRLHLAAFFAAMCETLSKLVVEAEDHVEDARRRRAEVAAYSFKGSTVIGATVVGATRRLQALRASEPFAMIVEEACEVMEPTLISVIAVRSLQKLELVGDHRQLPAFVQQCWFSIQTSHPSIKTSLFERLVDGKCSKGSGKNVSGCTILDEQRRMRPEICDLTRGEYSDLVDIGDHACTVQQRIGDKSGYKSSLVALTAEQKPWSKCGQTVPGLQLPVFFWNICSKESRASVGLSRCNVAEAEACMALVRWLLLCGVPADAITVITPYKGQKMTITRKLRKVRGAQVGWHQKARQRAGVLVSTVDRYQGDENDIVILSLVSTRPGNRFVALRNRFIVAASRARIGFYIVGASDALSKGAHGGSGPPHWLRFLTDLKSLPSRPEEHDKPTQVSSRIGSKLALTCPRHSDVLLEVSEPSDLPATPDDVASFCSQPCHFKLPWCGHKCDLRCHSPTVTPHTQKCAVLVERPCERHEDIPLVCSDLGSSSASSSASLSDALEAYRCAIPVEYRRHECPHVVELSCTDFSGVTEGTLALPDCDEVVGDYAHPVCGHIRKKPKCHLRRKWEEVPPPCHEIVHHSRACGCKARMHCHESIKESAASVPPTCLEDVSKPRPRCSHLLSSRCHEADLLEELRLDHDGDFVAVQNPVVTHGLKYGPSETEVTSLHSEKIDKVFPECRVPIMYDASCGHRSEVPCCKAFEYASGKRQELICREAASFKSPICGHEISAPCHLRGKAAECPGYLWVQHEGAEKAEGEVAAHEVAVMSAPAPLRFLKQLSGSCSLSVSVVRKCGHVLRNIPCSALFNLLSAKLMPLCEDDVSVTRICGHSYEVPCHRRGDTPPPCNHPVETAYSYPCGHDVVPGVCHLLESLRAADQPKCPTVVRRTRARCMHKVDVPCHVENCVTIPGPGAVLEACDGPQLVVAGVDYCESAANVPPCSDLVSFKNRCGHVLSDIPCGQAFLWASEPLEAPRCQVLVDTTSPLCQHLLSIPCCQVDAVLAYDAWSGEEPPRITKHLEGNALICPLVSQDEKAPTKPNENVLALLKCDEGTILQRSCGHETNISCASVFQALKEPCNRTESVTCESCGSESRIRCHQVLDGVSFECRKIVEKVCGTCKVNVTKSECYREFVRCDAEVRVALGCGHEVVWICGDEDDPRAKLETEPCLSCVKQEWVVSRERAQLMLSQASSPAASSRGDTGHLLAQAAELRQSGGLQTEAPSVILPELHSNLKSRAFSLLSDAWIVKRTDLPHADASSLLGAFIDLLGHRVNLLGSLVANDSRDGDDTRTPPSLSDFESSYDVVYKVLRKMDTPDTCFAPVKTDYGLGTRCTLLSEDQLALDCQRRPGSEPLRICVAAVLRLRCLEDTPPFIKSGRPKAKRGKSKKKKSMEKMEEQRTKKACKLMHQTLGRCYDHVSPLSHEASSDEVCSDRIYWVPGVVLPLVQLSIEPHKECAICMDDVLPAKGWSCGDGHFLCRGCFDRHVEEAGKPGATVRVIDESGNVICPQDGCSFKFEVSQLLRQRSDATETETKDMCERLGHLQRKAHAQRETRLALEQQKAKLEAEFLRIQAIKDADEGNVEMLRMHITEDILTLKCPRKECAAAFVDFDGCFALTCHLCHVQFCAWCVTHSAPDVHRHVVQCDQAQNCDVYGGSFAVFESHQRQRRKRLLIARLRRENAQVRTRVLERMRGEFRDLGIEISTRDLE